MFEAARSTRAAAIAALAVASLGLSACGGSSGGSGSKTTAAGAAGAPSAKVTVPSVKGQEPQFALARLQKLGLAASTRKRWSSQAKGLVVKTDPPGGSLVARGTSVSLIVSRGPKPLSTVSQSPSGGSGQPSGSGSGSSGTGSGGSGSSSCPSGEYVRADGSCGPVNQSGGAPANTHRGHSQIQQNPDCQNAPPPPKGYKGPVQC